MTFTIGCDPELFVKDSNGKPLSAHNLIKGTKKEPYKIGPGAYQVDGIAAEFNTDPVLADDFLAFNANVVNMLKLVEKAVKESNPDARLFLSPVLDFDQAFADSLPDEAKELGCDPDFDAYTLEPNPRPDGDRLFRTGAGHLHIGWGAGIPTENREHLEICANFVKMLDATTGLVMTYIDRDPRRRELYGKAGAFRPKNYGVEYRMPSNVWLKHVAYRELVFRSIHYAIQKMRSGYTVEKLLRISPESVRTIINTGDYKSAENFIEASLGSFYRTAWSKVETVFIETNTQK